MHELLPEFWHDQKDGGKTSDKAKAKKRALDLSVWLQCFAVYVGVLGPKFPPEVPELMAYMCATCRGNHTALECPARSVNATPVGPHRRAPTGPRTDPPY